MKDYDKSKESSYLKYWDVNHLFGWNIFQKLPLKRFKWIENKFQFSKDFIENYNVDSDEGCFPRVDVQ